MQFLAPGDGIGQTLLPVRLCFKHNRQLDHLFGLQLCRRYAVQHVARGLFCIRRSGQLHDAARAETGQGVEGKLSAAVMRFIDDYKGPTKAKHVGE